MCKQSKTTWIGDHSIRNALWIIPSIRQQLESPARKINGGDIRTEDLDSGIPPDRARPSSLHTGGVNCALADGSTRLLNELIDYEVYKALMTPFGSESDVADPNFTITDRDL